MKAKTEQELQNKITSLCVDNRNLKHRIYNLNKELEKLEKIIAGKNEYIEWLGEIADICTKRETAKVCGSCRCGKKKD